MPFCSQDLELGAAQQSLAVISGLGICRLCHNGACLEPVAAALPELPGAGDAGRVAGRAAQHHV